MQHVNFWLGLRQGRGGGESGREGWEGRHTEQGSGGAGQNRT